MKKKRPCPLRILFILKIRHCYYGHYGAGLSSGLFNSARFAAEMLQDNGYKVKLVEVTDNNDIDREVFAFKPDVCIVEALWVVPSKFAVLQHLHPNVTWIVRVHSEAAFLAQEGIAIEWISEYPRFSNVYVAANSVEAFDQFRTFFPDKGLPPAKLLYLPTYYPAPRKPIYQKKPFCGTTINIACMGALRPLKNSLIQAMAAMRFVDEECLRLRFHINRNVSTAWDIDNAAYRNIVSLFKNTKHECIEHAWMGHKAFLAFLKGIDVGMQVSLSETFNIVAADTVASGTPIVGSPAIRWLEKKSQANPITVDLISSMLAKAVKGSLIKANLDALRDDAAHSEHQWIETLKGF